VPKHDRLVLIPMPEATTRAAALMAGRSISSRRHRRHDPTPQVGGHERLTLPYPHNWHYQLNFVDPPFNDVRVRRAANHAMNGDEMLGRHRAARLRHLHADLEALRQSGQVRVRHQEGHGAPQGSGCYPAA